MSARTDKALRLVSLLLIAAMAAVFVVGCLPGTCYACSKTCGDDMGAAIGCNHPGGTVEQPTAVVADVSPDVVTSAVSVVVPAFSTLTGELVAAERPVEPPGILLTASHLRV